MIENNEHMKETKKTTLLEKFKTKELKLEKTIQERQQELLVKTNQKNILRQDRKDTVIRIQKIQNYKKEQLLDKLNEKM